MRAIQISAIKTLKAIDIPEPGQPAVGEALVRTHRMGVCGTDISCYLGKFPFFDFPRIPGLHFSEKMAGVFSTNFPEKNDDPNSMNSGDLL